MIRQNPLLKKTSANFVKVLQEFKEFSLECKENEVSNTPQSVRSKRSSLEITLTPEEINKAPERSKTLKEICTTDRKDENDVPLDVKTGQDCSVSDNKSLTYSAIPEGRRSPEKISGKAERRKINMIKGKFFKWRKFYPNCEEVAKTHESSKLQIDQNPDFFKNGGLIFVPNPYEHILLVSSNISNFLTSKFYDNLKSFNMNDLTLDDIADSAMKNQIIP